MKIKNGGNTDQEDKEYDKEAAEELKPLEPFKEEIIGATQQKGWLWPTEGKYAAYYQYFLLIHCIYYQFFVVSRISFEKKPKLFVIYLECYMDLIYLIDMFRCFTEPYTKDGRLVTNNKLIAKHYLMTWFLLDVYSFFPLAYLRYISKWEDGSKDDIKNILSFNFERLPRFYKIMLFF